MGEYLTAQERAYLMHSRSHKYIKREGTSGNYRYTYPSDKKSMKGDPVYDPNLYETYSEEHSNEDAKIDAFFEQNPKYSKWIQDNIYLIGYDHDVTAKYLKICKEYDKWSRWHDSNGNESTTVYNPASGKIEYHKTKDELLKRFKKQDVVREREDAKKVDISKRVSKKDYEKSKEDAELLKRRASLQIKLINNAKENGEVNEKIKALEKKKVALLKQLDNSKETIKSYEDYYKNRHYGSNKKK